MLNFYTSKNYLPRFSRYTIGVDSQLMNTSFAFQRNSMACWATTAQMFLATKGLRVDQTVFTNDLCGVDEYGRIKNCGATPNQIDVYLNGCGRDNFGKQYCASATLRTDSLTGDDIFDNLSAGNPIISAYLEPRASIGHVVLITGAVILEDHYTGVKTIEKLIIRDPANTVINRLNKGRYSVDAGNFIAKTYAWWMPQVSYESWGYWLVA